MIELRADKDDIAELLKGLKVLPRGLEKAGARAINRTLTSTRAFMVKEVRKEYAITAKEIRSELLIRKASWSHLYGYVGGAGSPGIPLISFARTKAVPSTKRLKSGDYRPLTGIPVLVRKSKGKQPAKGVFLARMASGHVGAFKREDPSTSGRVLKKSKARAQQTTLGSRYIREAYGPSPIKILSSDYYDEKIEDFADETLQKNFSHEADFLLKKMGLR